MNETSSIQFGTTAIRYSILRTSRRKTVSLIVEPGGRLVVRAPSTATVDRLDGIVHGKAAWVVRRLRRASERPPPLSQREFVSGEMVRYLGRQYRLRIVRTGPDLRFQARVCELHPGRSVTARDTFVSALRRRAEAYLPRRLAAVCRVLRLDAPTLVVREQRSRWGSCSRDGVLRINWRIIQAPAPLIDYVLVHELAHRVHRNHDHAFWRTVSKWLPDYDTRRARLRELGPTLVW